MPNQNRAAIQFLSFGFRFIIVRPSGRFTLCYSGDVTKMRFHVVPNAKQDKIAGEHGGAIKIKLRAPAMEGKANAALRRFLAEKLRIAERHIVLEHGEKSREKIISIDNLSDAEVRRRLAGEAE
jgi:uncharacterized protein (TIGR00251 family)